MRRAHTCLWGWRIRTYGGGAYVPVKLCQAFSPLNKVWVSITPPLRDGAEIEQAFSPCMPLGRLNNGQWLIVNGYAWYRPNHVPCMIINN